MTFHRNLTRSGICRNLGLLMALAALMCAATQATILEKIDFDRLCKTADRIVLGTCTEKSSGWDEKKTTILTTYTFQVKQTLQGDASETVDVVTLGGIVGNQGMQVAGSPSFRNGDDYVLFLTRGEDGSYTCLGWTQGRYEVHRDAQTGEETVLGDTSGASLAERGKSTFTPGARGKRITLPRFLESIQGITSKIGKE